MATKKNEVADNATNKMTSSADKKVNVFVTAGAVQNEDKTIVGFGALKPYEKEGNTINPGARDVLYKISQVDSFLKAVEANKIGIDIKGIDKNDNASYMKANVNFFTGTTPSGKAYGFNKIIITVQPELKTEKGEIIQEAQKLFATKGQKGYAFDNNCDEKLIKKFNLAIENGADFTLAAKHNSTLEKYPKLMEVVNEIKGRSANVELDFVKQQGVVIKSIKLNDKSGNEIGEAKLTNHATAPKKAKSKER